MKIKTKYFLYILFAFISTMINIGTQHLVNIIITMSGNHFLINTIIKDPIKLSLLISMFCATIIAFLFKFVIDKIIIFKDKSTEITENIRQILIYGLFALFTTLIFWVFEISFKYFFKFQYSEYMGAIIGLTIGYTIKFVLDSKYVFNKTI